jgi:N-methylhydantoinase A
MADREASYRLGCDIGGTFSDLILVNDTTNEMHFMKCLNTPDDPARAIGDGVRALARRVPDFLGDTRHVIHGTTVVINTVIERKGARTALLSTAGFRDVLEMRRHQRADVYDVHGTLPAPLIPRRLRIGIHERMLSDGRVHAPLDEDQLASVVRSLLDNRVESIAIAFLHSYRNPDHERRAREVIRSVSENVRVSLSSDVLPEIKEFERTSTTAVNAYVEPIVRRYLDRVEAELHVLGFRQDFYVMHSAGGLADATLAREQPVRLIESGPVAGALAAAQYAAVAGVRDLVAFDMGGTTAKGCLITDGVMPVTSDFEVDRAYRFQKGSGLPVAVPAVDLVEIGAGGGSIARVNDLGLVQVGPESAGASPGPICYGLGGAEPTVTDSDLVLGYLDAEYFLGGDMPLDVERTREGLREHIASPLGVSVEAAAWVIHDLVNENMAAAIRAHVAGVGGDLSRASLFAFGGAGPVHACNLATKLGVKEILVPPAAGLGSVVGFLLAPTSFDVVRTYKHPLADYDQREVDELFVEMEAEGRQVLANSDRGTGFLTWRSADMNYVGQSHPIHVDVPDGPLTREALRDCFRAVYKAHYGYFHSDIDAEVINLRLRIAIDEPPRELQLRASSGSDLEGARKGGRMAYVGATGSMEVHDVYDRYLLPAGARFDGPAIIEERESTTVVGAGGSVEQDEYGMLRISHRGSA